MENVRSITLIVRLVIVRIVRSKESKNINNPWLVIKKKSRKCVMFVPVGPNNRH
jgi:hypothetical protein